jgi:hypothetical protein
MRFALILIGFVWGVKSTKLLPEDFIVLKIKPEQHSEYFLLQESETLYYLIVNGNSQKIVATKVAENIWNKRVGLDTESEKTDFLKTAMHWGKWPTGAHLGYDFGLASSMESDIWTGWSFAWSMQKQNKYFGVYLWTENHNFSLHNAIANDSTISYSSYGYGFFVGVPILRFHLITHQSSTPQFLFLEDNGSILLRRQQGDFINSFEKDKSRQGNWMGIWDFRLGYFNFKVFQDNDSYNESIWQVLFQEMPMSGGTWGTGVTIANQKYVPGIWNEFYFMEFFSGFNVNQTPLKFFMKLKTEFWYWDSRHYQVGTHFSVHWNDFFGDQL